MKLEDSIGRFSVRKVLRFSMKKLYSRAEWLEDWVSADEQRAYSLNVAKSAIEAEHLTMIRRVFKSLPNPLPEAPAIRKAFEADPEYRTLSGRNADKVMKLIVNRCVYNGWTIPDAIKDLEHWATLYVKWHWHCSDRLKLSGEGSLPRQWAGCAKADVEKTCPLLKAPKKRKPSRNYWFDHAPFRMLFDNRTCGMSWVKEDFAASRTFLLLDGPRILVGVVPRASQFCPYTIPDATADEPSYLLYEESEGEKPHLRAIPKVRIEVPAKRDFLMLFELDGKALRSKSNLNAMYLRALFTPENLADPVYHLDRTAEFHVRKGTDIPRRGHPDHFRQRFTEDKLFLTIHLTINPQLAAIGQRPQPYGDLSRFLAANPEAKFIDASKNGEAVSRPLHEADRSPLPHSSVGTLIGSLARRAIAEDACVIFDPATPKRILDAAADKFEYIVLKDRDPFADGGVMRGYQISDRLFTGSLATAQILADRVRAEHCAAESARIAAEDARRAKAERKAANRAKAEEDRRIAMRRRSAVPPDFSAPPFQTGALRFKVEFKTSDNACHSAECRADTRDEMFQKARAVGVRPSRVTCLDAVAAPVTAPVREGADGTVFRLKRLDALKEQGLISDAEYAAQRAKIIAEL